MTSAILPGLYRKNSSFSEGETATLAFTIYFNFAAFLLLLAFCLFNMEMYLRRQGKWRVFPLGCFYTLSLFMIVIRCTLALFTIQAAENFDIFGVAMPALLKVLIGLVQIEVMIELILRVKEGTRTQT